MEIRKQGQLIHFFKTTPVSSSPCITTAITLLFLSAPAALSSLLSATALRTGPRERLAPPLKACKSQAGVTVHSSALKLAGRQLVSSSPLSARSHWIFQGGGGVIKSSDSWCYTTECWPWTCPVCLPVRPRVFLLSVCLSVCCIGCQSAPSAIVSLHSFRLCTDRHQPSWRHHWLCLHAHYNSAFGHEITLIKLFIFARQ